MIPWAILTEELDELDAIRAQLREARAQERTVTFFEVLMANRTLSERAHVGDAIVLAGGWCIVHWKVANHRGVAFYESLTQLGIAMHIDGEFLLSMVDTSERKAGDSCRSETRSTLTDSERRVLAELGHGKANKEIATALALSPRTVRNSTSRIFAKLGVSDRVQAALLARDLDLTAEGTRDALGRAHAGESFDRGERQNADDPSD